MEIIDRLFFARFAPFLARRIPARATLARELHAWERDRNLTPRSIRWQFTITAARTKLRKLHPSFND